MAKTVSHGILDRARARHLYVCVCVLYKTTYRGSSAHCTPKNSHNTLYNKASEKVVMRSVVIDASSPSDGRRNCVDWLSWPADTHTQPTPPSLLSFLGASKEKTVKTNDSNGFLCVRDGQPWEWHGGAWSLSQGIVQNNLKDRSKNK